MIALKKKISGIIKFGGVCVICCALFVSGGYFYLRKSFAPAEKNVSSVPYTFPVPENKGIMFEICGDLTFIYLDFENEKLSVIFPPGEEYGSEIYGYPIDFSVKSDYSLIGAIVDYAGGIELSDGGTTLRYTGVQIADLLSRTVDAEEEKRKIFPALFKKIAEEGIDSEVFQYVVENSETDITIPDCYNWHLYIEGLCANGAIIN